MEALHTHKQHDRHVLISLGELPGPRGIPLLGNAHQIRPEQMHRQLEDWSKTYGDRYQISLGMRRMLVCSNSDDIASVLKDRPNGFRRTSRLEMVAKELQMAGVFAANGEDWRRQRTFVMHAFNPAHVKSYFPSLQSVTSRFLRRWARHADDSVSFELEPDLMRYTVDVTAGLAFGSEVNTIESDGAIIQEHLSDIFRMLQKRLFAPLPYWHWVKLADDRALDESIRAVEETIRGFISATRERMERNASLFERPSNLMEAMIAARDENKSALSEADLAGNTLTMLLAGEDTTAHTLAWLIYFLSRSPDVFFRIRAELDKIMGEDALPSRHEQLSEMDFVEACINESMRLRPVAPLIAVEANHDTAIANVAVPKGTVILMLTRIAAMDEKNFANGSEFQPERWLMPASDANRRKVSIPFGAGPRLCPGRFLAVEEMKMVISMLVKNFDIERIDTPDGQAPQERLTFTMAPVGLRLKLNHR
jgi:cytochrome P450